MGWGQIFVTAPAVAAAAGLHFLERYHSNYMVAGDGLLHSSQLDLTAKMKGDKKTAEPDQMPKLAPQFDGLFCFETLVAPPHH